jgi:[acyl-carrier-protein] S-malonyltransferase
VGCVPARVGGRVGTHARRCDRKGAVKGVLLLFPGQGSQELGMCHYLWETFPAAMDTFREAEDILGWDLRGLCLNGPSSELRRTDKAQPAIFVCSVAAWRVLESRGMDFAVALGHSLGEYSALVATGQLDFAQALRVVEARGAAMWECGLEQAGAMAAIVGLDDEAVESVCAEVGEVWPANYNCPGQVVVSGRPPAVESAGVLALRQGARRVIPLQVSGAFHSPLVAGAADDLSLALRSVVVGPPVVGRFFSTTEVRYPDPHEIKETLIRQLTSPVRFTQSVRVVLTETDSGIEVGPGGVLSGLVKRASSDYPVFSTSGAASLDEVLTRLAEREATDG